MFCYNQLLCRFVIAKRSCAVAGSFGGRVDHNAEYRQYNEHSVHNGKQLVTKLTEVQSEAEHRCDCLN